MTQPPPKQPPLERTLKIFTPEQFEMLLGELEKVKEHGFGEVSICFNHHKPSKLDAALYKVFPVIYNPE